MNIIPTILEKTYNREYAFDIYSKLLNERIIFITGEINDEVAANVISCLLYLDSINHDDISLYINSPGGKITSGMAIYDTMNFIGSDVVTIGIGLCASMASFLLSSGSVGKRYILKNCEVMIHQPLGGTEGQATDIKIHTDHILKIKDKMNKILSINTKQNINKIKKDTERDYYMDSNEAKKYGLIDNIL